MLKKPTNKLVCKWFNKRAPLSKLISQYEHIREDVSKLLSIRLKAKSAILYGANPTSFTKQVF